MNIDTEQVFLVNSAPLEQDNLHTAAPLQRTYSMPVTVVHPEAPSSSSMCIPQPLDPPSRTQTCRLCATVTELVVPIFEGEGLQNGLADKIHQHLPIKVSEKDILPVVLCFQCTSTLLAWHELVLCCVQADAAMRERCHQIQQQQLPAVQSSQTEIKHEKSPHKLFKFIKTALTEYLHSINMDDQVIAACQKCHNNPTFTINDLINHLVHNHDLEKSDKGDIISFIRDNVTFEESLISDMELNVDSDNPDVKVEDDSEIHFVEDSKTDNQTYEIKPETSTQGSLPTLLCPYCDSAFSSTTRLIHHLGTHVKLSIDDGFKCCNVKYNTKKDFAAHLQEKHVNRLIYDADTMCKSCSFKAETSEELIAHIAKRHSETKPKQKKLKESDVNQKFIPAVCPECNKVYSNVYNMMIHRKTHERQETFMCDRCAKEYSTKGNLDQHIRLAHEGKLPHACGLCGERFPTRSARDVHSRIHTGEKPFHCEICDVSFRAKNTLLRHLDIHMGVRNHECPVCKKKFNKFSQLTAHVRVHWKKK